MTNHDDDQIARWLDVGPDRGPTAALDAAFARLPTIRQRPGWMVDLVGGTIDSRPGDRRAGLSFAVSVGLLVIVVVVGTFVAGSVDPTPEPSATVVPSPTAEPTTTAEPASTTTSAAEVIVFTETLDLVGGEEDCTGRRCRKTWVAIVNADGTGQRRLFPDAPPNQSVRAVAPVGSRMIVQGVNEGDDLLPSPPYYLTDLRGSEPQLLDTGCAQPCVGDWIGRFAFSPDGTRLAFVRSSPTGPEEGDTTVIAVMGLASGETKLLESTITGSPALGDTEDPRWSPDGRRLLFSRSSVGNDGSRTILDTELYVVDADGSNLRQLVPTELFARDAQWSPDGSLIAFTSAVETLTIDDFGKLENWHQLNDIYTVRPDGSDLRRLTSFTAGPVPDPPGDVGARFPAWTRDGHIVFNRRVADPAKPHDSASDWEFWLMAADGTGASSLGTPDAPTLSEIGCVECAYPVPDWGDPIAFGSWRPSP